MTNNDLDEILNLDLRQADKNEIEASLGVSWKEGLERSLDNSVITWVVIYKENIEGIFGLGQIKQIGVPWFLATDKFNEFKFAFARTSLEVVHKEMLRRYNKLVNFVDSRHLDSIKWLTWLGFKIDILHHFYFYDKNIPFYMFSKEDQ